MVSPIPSCLQNLHRLEMSFATFSERKVIADDDLHGVQACESGRPEKTAAVKSSKTPG